MPETIGKTYDLGGKDSLEWSKIIDIISLSSNKKKWKVPVPVFIVKALASLLDSFQWFPITREQITMLLEGNVVSKNYFNEFNIQPINFEKKNLSYLNSKN